MLLASCAPDRKMILSSISGLLTSGARGSNLRDLSARDVLAARYADRVAPQRASGGPHRAASAAGPEFSEFLQSALLGSAGDGGAEAQAAAGPEAGRPGRAPSALGSHARPHGPVHETRAPSFEQGPADLTTTQPTGSWGSHHVYELPEIRPLLHDYHGLDLTCSSCGLLPPAP
jgi:hypothetical protein